MRKILTLAAAVCMLLALCLPAAASGFTDKLGSIEVNVRYDEKPVVGGTVTCIQVGVISQSGNSLYYRRVLDGERLDNIEDPALPKELAKFAEEKNLSGETLTVGTEGTAVFKDLKAGLYLIKQDTPAEGFTALAPFLVSVPYQEGGRYIFDVTAKVKSELEHIPETTPTEPSTEPTGPSTEPTGPSTEPTGPSTEPSQSTQPSTQTSPTGPKLPQTGQLNWPVPVLVVLGLGLFSVGWMIRTKEKPDNTEPEAK